MESEGERAQWEGEEGESAGQDTSREPPVLPVDGTDTGPSEGAAQGQPQDVRAGGASELWGLSEKIDAWQVSSIPQEKTYFALDVSRILSGSGQLCACEQSINPDLFDFLLMRLACLLWMVPLECP